MSVMQSLSSRQQPEPRDYRRLTSDLLLPGDQRESTYGRDATPAGAEIRFVNLQPTK